MANLVALRHGDAVQLRFAVPQSTSDDQPLRATQLRVVVCRSVDAGACQALPAAGNPTTVSVPPPGTPALTTWTDDLPLPLRTGPLRLLTYRVALFNPLLATKTDPQGRSAGYSAPAFSAAGTAPPPPEHFTATGTRLGVWLHWTADPAAPGVVELRREALALLPGSPETSTPDKAAPGRPHGRKNAHAGIAAAPGGTHEGQKPAAALILLASNTPAGQAGTLDSSAAFHLPYRYTAERRWTPQLGGHLVELFSLPGAPAEITLEDIYPPPAPTGLAAVPFGEAPSFAIDLIWQPSDDPRLAGYNVFRRAAPDTASPGAKLNAKLVPEPAFHDTTAVPGEHYVYTVTAVSANGHASLPVSAESQP